MLNEPYAWNWQVIAGTLFALFVIVTIVAIVNTRWRNSVQPRIKRIEEGYRSLEIEDDRPYRLSLLLAYLEKFLVNHCDPKLGTDWMCHLEYFLFEGVKNKFREIVAAQWQTGKSNELSTTYEYRVKVINEVCKELGLIDNDSFYPAYHFREIVIGVTKSKYKETELSYGDFVRRSTLREKVNLVTKYASLLNDESLSRNICMDALFLLILEQIQSEVEKPDQKGLGVETAEEMVAEISPIFKNTFLDHTLKGVWEAFITKRKNKNVEVTA